VVRALRASRLCVEVLQHGGWQQGGEY